MLGYMCARSIERWLGVIQPPEELVYTSCTSSPKLQIITLSGCQQSVGPSGGTSHPELLHFCHTCTLALHAPPEGTSIPKGYVYNSICVLIWKRKLQGKRMCRLLYNSERAKLDPADVMWLNTKTPVQKKSSQNLKLDKWEQNSVSVMNSKTTTGPWNHKEGSKKKKKLLKQTVVLAALCLQMKSFSLKLWPLLIKHDKAWLQSLWWACCRAGFDVRTRVKLQIESRAEAGLTTDSFILNKTIISNQIQSKPFF